MIVFLSDFREIPEVRDGSAIVEPVDLLEPCLAHFAIFLVRCIVRVKRTQGLCRAETLLQDSTWERLDFRKKCGFPSKLFPCETRGFYAGTNGTVPYHFRSSFRAFTHATSRSAMMPA